jgi:CBS domain-containing protein
VLQAGWLSQFISQPRPSSFFRQPVFDERSKGMDLPQERSIRDWMTTDPVTIASSVTLPEAYWLMVENRIRRLLVVDSGKLVGIVTMEDLRGSFHTDIIAINPLKVNQILSEMQVRQLMSKDPISIDPESSVIQAAQTMLEHRISTLPVLKAGRVVGIITESDLFRVLVDICLGQTTSEGQKVKTENTKGHE